MLMSPAAHIGRDDRTPSPPPESDESTQQREPVKRLSEDCRSERDPLAVMDSRALEEELSRPLCGTVKGVPLAAFTRDSPVATAAVADQRWNLLKGDLPFPNAVIRESALKHNLEWMQGFAEGLGLLLSPHGKTTMAPQLFERQLRQGAWGITVATAHQLRVCRRFGIRRVFLANQLVSGDDIRYVVSELARDPGFEFYCLVDSVQGVERLEAAFESVGGPGMGVLLEVGIPGGRAGCRSLAQSLAVLDAIAGCAYVGLCGIQCYEGIGAGGDHATDLARVEKFLGLFREVYEYCRKGRLFDSSKTVILSAGGSAYFDVVGRALLDLAGGDAQVLIRSGCYITHDSAFYRRMGERFAERNPDCAQELGGLKPALEIWGQVQSVPEPGLAILCVGKRDISHDLGQPVPLLHKPLGAHSQPVPVGASWKIMELNDQHAYLAVPRGQDIVVGDLVALGVSHPCTTFDKWRLLWLVDDAYQVTGAVWTYF